ncbi:MAG: sirohydrochlorin cobaltochelatase [Schwartzia sp.]|nr:sirohydrochlorin cobaltochelatase [Schwartzia sp. (in: firmicutes)]
MEKKKRTHRGAGYTLHREVKRPTPSLLRAAQIGVLDYKGTAPAKPEDKDALLVVSYGAARKEARALAVEPLMEAIAEANPDADIYEAYSSPVMRAKAKVSAGAEIPSAEEALDALLASGYTRVAIASLHLFPGAEYACLVEMFNAVKTRFRRLVLGVPLLYWMGQEEQRDDAADVTQAMQTSLPPTAEDEATLLLAHGTKHPSNAFYSILQTRFEMAGWDRAYVYTLAGWPRLAHIVPRLRAQGVRRVRLVPMMLAVGAHAARDMAGDAPGSHRSRLIEEGFEVEVFQKGLGELPAVRELYVERVNEAWDKLRE